MLNIRKTRIDGGGLAAWLRTITTGVQLLLALPMTALAAPEDTSLIVLEGVDGSRVVIFSRAAPLHVTKAAVDIEAFLPPEGGPGQDGSLAVDRSSKTDPGSHRAFLWEDGVLIDLGALMVTSIEGQAEGARVHLQQPAGTVRDVTEIFPDAPVFLPRFEPSEARRPPDGPVKCCYYVKDCGDFGFSCVPCKTLCVPPTEECPSRYRGRCYLDGWKGLCGCRLADSCELCPAP